MYAENFNVIVIDDEPDVAYIIQQFLIKCGFDSIAFTNPLLCWEYFKINSQKQSLIITDLRMPGLSGIELAKKIRSINESIKIFLITAFEIDDLSKCKEFVNSKIDKVIQKPIELSRLKEEIYEISGSIQS